MARKLEGQVFYACSNNGVVALVSADVWQNMWRVRSIVRRLEEIKPPLTSEELWEALGHIPTTPIFTFAMREERLAESPWFTGDESVLVALREYIREEGGRVEQNGFFVPFSNGAEMGFHGAKAQREELQHVTSEGDFIATFGISRDEICRGASSRR